MTDVQMKTYDWDDEITFDGEEAPESVLLPAGSYPFEVVKIEKSWYDGSQNLPPCNMVKAFLRVDGGELGTSLIVENLYLCEKCIWKVSAFLRSIGLKKHGEAISGRAFDQCAGEHGRCRIKIDSFQGKDGQPRQNNKLDRFYDPSDTPAAAPKKAVVRGTF